MIYMISFKKFKSRVCKKAAMFIEGSDQCFYNSHISTHKCTEKLCPVLKTCKKTDANWNLRKEDQ